MNAAVGMQTLRVLGCVQGAAQHPDVLRMERPDWEHGVSPPCTAIDPTAWMVVAFSIGALQSIAPRGLPGSVAAGVKLRARGSCPAGCRRLPVGACRQCPGLVVPCVCQGTDSVRVVSSVSPVLKKARI